MSGRFITGLFGVALTLKSVSALPEPKKVNEDVGKRQLFGFTLPKIQTVTQTTLHTTLHSTPPADLTNSGGFVTTTMDISGTHLTVLQKVTPTSAAPIPPIASPLLNPFGGVVTTTVTKDVTAFMPLPTASAVSLSIPHSAAVTSDSVNVSPVSLLAGGLPVPTVPLFSIVPLVSLPGLGGSLLGTVPVPAEIPVPQISKAPEIVESMLGSVPIPTLPGPKVPQVVESLATAMPPLPFVQVTNAPAVVQSVVSILPVSVPQVTGEPHVVESIVSILPASLAEISKAPEIVQPVVSVLPVPLPFPEITKVPETVESIVGGLPFPAPNFTPAPAPKVIGTILSDLPIPLASNVPIPVLPIPEVPIPDFSISNIGGGFPFPGFETYQPSVGTYQPGAGTYQPEPTVIIPVTYTVPQSPTVTLQPPLVNSDTLLPPKTVPTAPTKPGIPPPQSSVSSPTGAVSPPISSPTLTASVEVTNTTPQTIITSAAPGTTTVTTSTSRAQGKPPVPYTPVPIVPPTATKPKPQPTYDGTCRASGSVYVNGQTATGPKGGKYTIYCNEDNSQGAFLTVPVKKGGFQTCFDACDTVNGCEGFSYWGTDSGNCYLKSAKGSFIPSSNPDIMSAFKDVATSGQPDVNSYQPAPVKPPPKQNTPGSCETLDSPFADYQGKKWDVKCDTDYPGNDIATVACETFEHCFHVCTDYPGCVAFSYLPGTCYLKERALHPVSKPNVDAAALVDPPAYPTTTAKAPPKETSPVTSTVTEAPVSTDSIITTPPASATTYACNPAHSYPEGQQCISTNGHLTLVIPTATTSTATSMSTGSKIACDPTHSYPHNVQCLYQDGVWSLVSAQTSLLTVTVPAPSVFNLFTGFSQDLPLPTGTSSSLPIPTGAHVKDVDHCRLPQGSSKRFNVVTKVVHGDPKFDGLYISFPSRDIFQGFSPQLTFDPHRAAPAISRLTDGAVSFKREDECSWSGLDVRLSDNEDHHIHHILGTLLDKLSNNKKFTIGDTLFSEGFASGSLFYDGPTHDITFESTDARPITMLACESPDDSGHAQLKFAPAKSILDPVGMLEGLVEGEVCASVILEPKACPRGEGGLCPYEEGLVI